MIYRLVQWCNHECLSRLNSVKKHFITWPSISLFFFLSSFSLYLLGLYGFFQPYSHCSTLSSYRVFLKSCPGIVQVWLYKSHNSDSGAEEQYHLITRYQVCQKKLAPRNIEWDIKLKAYFSCCQIFSITRESHRSDCLPARINNLGLIFTRLWRSSESPYNFNHAPCYITKLSKLIVKGFIPSETDGEQS